jgi:hypothetical protein
MPAQPTGTKLVTAFTRGVQGQPGETSPETLEARAFVAEKAGEVGSHAEQVSTDRQAVDTAAADVEAKRQEVAGNKTATDTARSAAETASTQAVATVTSGRLARASLAELNAVAAADGAVGEIPAGADAGYYQRTGGAWVKVSGDTVPGLGARLTPVETIVAPQVGAVAYASYEGQIGEFVVDVDEHVLCHLGPDGYEYFTPVKMRSLTTDRQVLGGQEVISLDASEYELSGVYDATVDEEFRILPPAAKGGALDKTGDMMLGPLELYGNATGPLEAVPLQQVQELLSTTALTMPLRRGTLYGGVLGDSRTQNSFAGSTGLLMQPRAYPFWAQTRSGGALRFRADCNFGVAGENTTQILDRTAGALVTAKAKGLDFISILCETNDALGAISTQNIQQIVELVLAAGIIPVVIAELPRGDTTAESGTTWSQNRIAQHFYAVEYIKRMAFSHGIRVVDAWAALVDPYSPIGAPWPNTFYDQLHLDCIAAMLLGYAVADAMADLARTPFPLLASNADRYNAVHNPWGNLIQNGMMDGTGGTKSGTGTINGSVSDIFALFATSSFTVNASKIVRNGLKLQRLEFSGTPVNGSQVFSLSQSIPVPGDIAAGDIVQLAGYVEVAAGSSGMYGPDLNLIVNDGSADSDVKVSVGYQPPASSTSANPSLAYSGPFISQPFVVPAGTAALKPTLQVKGKQGVPISGDLSTTQWSLRKLSTI